MLFIKTRQVLEMIGLGRTMVWRMVQEGRFPRPVPLTKGNSGYLLEAVEQWMQVRTQCLPWQPNGRGRISDHCSARRGRAKLMLARQAGAAQGSAR